MNTGEFTDSTLVSALEPVDIFDSFITGSRFSFKDLAKDIESFGNQNTQAADFLRSFERSGKPMEAAQKLFQESTRGQNQLFFNARDGTKISLYSPARFEQGSSISHVASSNAVTENFLMIPSLSPGVTLEAVMQRAGATSVYGADIQKVLETVGWPTPASSNLKSIKISLGFSGVSKGGASSNFGLIGLLTGFAVSILI